MVINKMIMSRNKRGWIRIVEAFIAILLITGVVLIVINQGDTKKEDLSSRVYASQLSILREIQLNDTARGEILNVSNLDLPVEWSLFDTYTPSTKTIIDDRTPSYLNCVGRLCSVDDICVLSNIQDRDIYAEYVVIGSNLATYNPRLLKIFCWTR